MHNRPTFSSRDLAQIGLFAAVVSVLGLLPSIRLPISPAHITLQTLGVMLAGALGGRRNGALAMVVFLALLAAGVPVLSGGRGGVAYLVGPSAGYILGWVVSAYLIGWWAQRRPLGGFWYLLAGNIGGGIIAQYAMGAPVLAMLTGRSLPEALVAGALIFLPGDLAKALVAAAIAVRVRRIYPTAATPSGDRRQRLP